MTSPGMRSLVRGSSELVDRSVRFMMPTVAIAGSVYGGVRLGKWMSDNGMGPGLRARLTDFGSPWKGLWGAARNFMGGISSSIGRAAGVTAVSGAVSNPSVGAAGRRIAGRGINLGQRIGRLAQGAKGMTRGWKIGAAGLVAGAAVVTPPALMGAAVTSFGGQRYQMRLTGYGAPYNPTEGMFLPSGIAGGAPAPNIMMAQSAMQGGRNYDMGADGNLALALHHQRRG